MRVTSFVAGLAILLAACGGEKKAEEQPAGGTDQAPAAEAPAQGGAPTATTGATHDVDMVLDGTAYKFVPDNLTIKSGDVVRFHNKSGGPHNVSFWADSIPAGAAEVLQKNMPDQIQPLEGPMVVEQDAMYQVSFAGAPAGEYKYYCLPHLALGMKASLTVQ